MWWMCINVFIDCDLVFSFLSFSVTLISTKQTIVACLSALVLMTNAKTREQLEAQAEYLTDTGNTNSEGSNSDGDKRQEKRGLDRHEHDYHVHEQKTITIVKKIPVPYPVGK